jgi:hypothetical protein
MSKVLRSPGRLLFIGAVLLSVVSSAGCSSTSNSGAGGSPLSSIAPKPAQDLINIKTKRIGEGAVIGAVVGGTTLGLVTLIMGGTPQQVARNAMIGVVVGAGGGVIFSAAVNKSAEQHATEQERYKKVIADADNNIASYKRAAVSAGTINAQERMLIDQLNRNLAAGEITAAGYRSQLVGAKNNIQALDRLISDANSDINDMTVLIGDTGDDALKNRRAELVNQKAALVERRRLLLEAYDRVPPTVGLNV